MNNEKFYNDPISITVFMDHEGEIWPQSFTWQDQQYTVVDLGRQWATEQGRHILVATGEGSRFELQLSRQTLRWYLKRAWQPEMMV